MSRYIETMRVVDGHVCNLVYHERRMNRTCREALGMAGCVRIADVLKSVSLPMGCSKLRFVYDKEGIHDLTCMPYAPRQINSLRLVYDNGISYSYKCADRSALDRLKKRQGDCDEILIIRDNHLTDTSIPTSHSATVNNGLHPLLRSFAAPCGRVCLTAVCSRSVIFLSPTCPVTGRSVSSMPCCLWEQPSCLSTESYREQMPRTSESSEATGAAPLFHQPGNKEGKQVTAPTAAFTSRINVSGNTDRPV